MSDHSFYIGGPDEDQFDGCWDDLKDEDARFKSVTITSGGRELDVIEFDHDATRADVQNEVAEFIRDLTFEVKFAKSK